MKEITEMATLQHPMRALCGLTRIIMPWNFAFEAIHGFLYASNLGLPELKDDPLRVQKLVKFINYVLGVNAAAWQREEPFLTCGNLKQEFGTYLQCQVSGAFVPVASAHSTLPQNQNKQNGKGRGGGYRGGGGCRGGRDGYTRAGVVSSMAAAEAISTPAAAGARLTTAAEETPSMTVSPEGTGHLLGTLSFAKDGTPGTAKIPPTTANFRQGRKLTTTAQRAKRTMNCVRSSTRS
jgi:hypothetical protein